MAFLFTLVLADLGVAGPATLAFVGLRSRPASALGVPVRPPIRGDLSELVVGVLRSILPAMREVLGEEFPGLLERAAGCLATVGAEGFRVVIERPIRERESVVGCLGEAETDGVLVVIERLIREVLLELVRLLERAAGCLAWMEVDGSRVLI
jgi:hypothetical protein